MTMTPSNIPIALAVAGVLYSDHRSSKAPDALQPMMDAMVQYKHVVTHHSSLTLSHTDSSIQHSSLIITIHTSHRR